jgi:hypothetical protein
MRAALLPLPLLLLTTRASADDDLRVGIGLGASVLGTRNTAFTGDAADIGESLGSRVERSDGPRLTPVLTESLWFGRFEPRGWTLGIESSQRYWSVWTNTRSNAAPSADYDIRRGVLAVDALFMAAHTSASESFRYVIGFGPAFYRISIDERGWLGDTSAADLRIGGRFVTGFRFRMSESFALPLEASIEYVRVPRRNDLVRDGGAAWTFGLAMRFEALL